MLLRLFDSLDLSGTNLLEYQWGGQDRCLQRYGKLGQATELKPKFDTFQNFEEVER